MNRILLGAALLTLASACQFRQGPINGTVNVSPALLGKAQNPDAVLFVVARNAGGVPVAVREIVNPVFPCKFSIGPSDLILPDAWTPELRLTARLATRLGPDGMPASDIEESRAVTARAGESSALLLLDKAVRPSWATAKLPTLRPDTDH